MSEQTRPDGFLGVPGLVYRPGFVPDTEQAEILAEVGRRPWLDDLKRRVQHYGYRYDYKAKRVDPSMFLGPLPAFALPVAERLLTAGLVPEMPDQLIVNEYEPGQGISAHVDCEPCFKDAITTVSLGWAYEMDFLSLDTGEVRSALLEAGSALVMRGDSRYRWMHRIKARRSDHGVPRRRRVSLTFRNVVLDG